jgi:restriction system protein
MSAFHSNPTATEKYFHLQSAKDKIRTLVRDHLSTLASRRMALITSDSFGIIDATAWNSEVQKFCNKVVLPLLNQYERAEVVKAGLSELATKLIEEPVRLKVRRLERALPLTTDVEGLSPLEYERYCALLLNAKGWRCELTKASGDQGADVLARKGKRFVVLQCKKYSSSVGNAAVQEVFAAQAHLRATHAAVVTNANYTRQAKHLANTTGVLLLHHAELDLLDSRLP